MNYEWLFSFVDFADQMNFTRAAQHLHITQPALHAQIRKLSESVGVQLYRRSGRTLVLTKEGRRLAAFGRQVRTRGNALLSGIRNQKSTTPVVLASGQGAFHYLLGDAIRRFLKGSDPLQVTTMSGPQAISAVQETKADLCVAVTERPPADLETKALCTVGQMVVVPPSHRLARQSSVKPRDLAGENIIVAPSKSPHRTMLALVLATHNVNWNVAVEATGWELMLRFAGYGLGIAVVNDFCEIPKGMVGVPLKGIAKVTYSLMTQTDPWNEATIRLRDLIVATVVHH